MKNPSQTPVKQIFKSISLKINIKKSSYKQTIQSYRIRI